MGEQQIHVPITESKALFSVSSATIFGAAKKGMITIHKAGGRSLLNVSEVCDWIEGRDA